MVNNEQAEEIRQFLIREMQRFGFGDIAEEANSRIEEKREDGESNDAPAAGQLLLSFLDELSGTLSNWSSHHLPNAIGRLNEALEETEGQPISTIRVELDERNERTYDLGDLPDYRKLIIEFREIKNIILEDRSENL